MSETSQRRFVVGLGNPGREYAATRHNVGFHVVDILTTRWNLPEQGKAQFEGLIWQATFGETPVTLMKPMTYMNLSGRAVGQMLAFFKAAPQQVLVVVDDFALPLGQLRIRPEGRGGGQKGLENILLHCNGTDVPRLRIGIGQPPGRMDPADFVLSRFRDHERDAIDVAIQRAADAAEAWLSRPIRDVMEMYNQRID